MKFDKDSLKNSLSIDDVYEYVSSLGGEPQMKNGFFISRTICHNHIGEGSYKLYYYDNTHLFRCYTDCDDTWDIYELTRKVKRNVGIEWSLPKAIGYVASYFGYSLKTFDFDDLQESIPDWDILKEYEKINLVEDQQRVELKVFDDSILRYLPHIRITPWEKEGITPEIIKSRGICYDPVGQSIIIPHYDFYGNLIGIRARTLIKEDEEYGKYRPAYLNGKLYNHPLSFALYNLNNSKDNIKCMKKAIIFESEKSCLKYASIFGEDNDISVACCGSSLITYQVKLLLDLGINEIIVAFDRQYKAIGDEEFKRWVKKLTNIHEKYSPYVNISFMFDKSCQLLDYKASPIESGKEVFLELYKNRIML